MATKREHDGQIDQATVTRLLAAMRGVANRKQLGRIIAERNAMLARLQELEEVRVWQETEDDMVAGVPYWTACGDDVADGL